MFNTDKRCKPNYLKMIIKLNVYKENCHQLLQHKKSNIYRLHKQLTTKAHQMFNTDKRFKTNYLNIKLKRLQRKLSILQ